MIEKRPQNFLAEGERRVAIEFDRAEHTTVSDFLAVMPGTQDQKHFVVAGIFRFDCFINRDVAVDVFLIPKTVYQHHGNLQRLGSEDLIDRLILPEGVVAGMFQQLAPETNLLEPTTTAQLSCRSGFHKHVIVVKVAGPPPDIIRARGLLIVDVAHALLAESAVVEPVVAPPAIDHGIHRHRNLERRMGIDQRHQRQKAVIGNAEDADLAVRLFDILYQPVNGVIGVGGVIDRGWVLWPNQRSVHHIVAFGTILAADILDYTDVPTLDDNVGGVVVTVQVRTEVRTLRVAGQFSGVIRCAREQDGRVLCALGHEDYRMQLYAVTHRYHYVAPDMVKAIIGRLHFGRRFARQSCGVLANGRWRG